MTENSKTDRGSPPPEAAPADYEVGKNRPPKATRFKKGVSGNPGGKRKTQPLVSPVDLFLATLARQVSFKEDGRSRSASALEVAFLALVGKAAKGDLAAIRELGRYLDRFKTKVDTDASGTAIDYAADVRRRIEDMARRKKLLSATGDAAIDAKPSPADN